MKVAVLRYQMSWRVARLAVPKLQALAPFIASALGCQTHAPCRYRLRGEETSCRVAYNGLDRSCGAAIRYTPR